MGYRNPRTTQERRANRTYENRRVEFEIGGNVLEVRIRIRGARHEPMLPQMLHDIVTRTQRSWKQHRLTQYKTKDMPAGTSGA
jgi:hypothetical protein